MTARRNQDWGEIGPLPTGRTICATDAELADWYTAQSGDELPLVGLIGGDLYRTLGGRGDRERPFRDDATRVAIDLVEVTLDGDPTTHMGVAHLVARRSWLFGPVTFVMNADFFGRWNVAPRAHPGDGRVDIVEGDLGLGDRLKAWRRLPSGTHVPHPGITQRRSAAFNLTFAGPRRIWLDGRPIGSSVSVAGRVRASALTVVL
ncbi:MAG: hypothetical protein HKN26_10305 [Acidimicrobiales bacterium]|nr:hypothetical protein [Acidimicrobiales bacterium]